MIEKPRRIGCKPKFLCILCKGDHLTHLCPAIVVVQEVWSLSDGPSSSELSLVSQQSNPSLVDEWSCVDAIFGRHHSCFGG
jgi:hypothetical protein